MLVANNHSWWILDIVLHDLSSFMSLPLRALWLSWLVCQRLLLIVRIGVRILLETRKDFRLDNSILIKLIVDHEKNHYDVIELKDFLSGCTIMLTNVRKRKSKKTSKNEKQGYHKTQL